jgi:hypothetical protein
MARRVYDELNRARSNRRGGLEPRADMKNRLGSNFFRNVLSESRKATFRHVAGSYFIKPSAFSASCTLGRDATRAINA